MGRVLSGGLEAGRSSLWVEGGERGICTESEEVMVKVLAARLSEGSYELKYCCQSRCALNDAKP